MTKKQRFLSRWKERGNIFFTLFAAVGVVGALGVGSVTLLKGPVQTMVKINQKQVTEEYAELGLRVMMMTVLNNDANCDDDDYLEPAEWEDPTPPFTAPIGGGIFPSAYGTKVTDPWGRRVGYCVWDHDVIDDAGCGGGTQKRLRGAVSGVTKTLKDNEPLMAIISSGPNQVFETVCNDYLPTPPTGYPPVTPLIVKPNTSDDLIINYSTIDAQQAMGDNWVFTSNETADGDAATTDQNLDFAQDVTFSGLLDLNKLGGGLTLPDFSGATCDGTTEGQLFRDSATTPPAVMVCDGGTFKAMSGSGGATGNYAYNFDPENPNCTLNNGGPFVSAGTFNTPSNAGKIWGDGTYLYETDNGGGLRVYTFNGSTFTEVTSVAIGNSTHVWGDGTYIYLAAGASGLYAYTFDGTTLTQVGSQAMTNAKRVWGNGAFLYVTDGTAGLHALTFDGSTFTIEDTFNTPDTAIGLWSDGTYIYVGDGASGIRAYTFNGLTFTEEGNFDTSGTAASIWGDGTYIYLADLTGGIRAFTFDGSTFTEEGFYNTTDARDVWGDGTHVYLADYTDGIRALTFDGTNFAEKNIEGTPSNLRGVWGDGQYIYVAADVNGITAFSGFECLSTTPDYSDRPDAPNTGIDYNYRAYSWGTETFGELGNGSILIGDQVSPTPVLENNEFHKVSVFTSHACGLKTDGSAWCWGDDTNGELGNGPDITANQETPSPVSGNHQFIDIRNGRYHTCALKENGTIWCWGSDNHGQLGDGGIGVSSDVPVQVSGVSDFIALSSSQLQSCGLRRNGEAWCWGDNDYGQLGNGDFDTDQGAPIQVQTSIPFVSISGHYQTTCGLTETGSIWCWGRNPDGEVGNGTIGGEYSLPVKVSTINDFISISMGTSSCGLRENGEAWCWGGDDYGELGNGATLTGNQPTPTKVVNIDDFIKIESGAFMTCGIRSNGKAYCWGRDTNGELGNGAGITGNQDEPTLVENLENIVDISCFNVICIATTKEPKQAPETAPTAPVIIEQKTSAGNTSGSHGLALNLNSTTNGDFSGLAFKIDNEDTAAGDDVSARILTKYATNYRGIRIGVSDGSAVQTHLKVQQTGALNLSSTGGAPSPKLIINEGSFLSWNSSRFDTGLALTDELGADNTAFYGIDATTGNAVILSGEDLLIQHSTTDGVTVTPIASFVNAGVPEFYGDIFMSGNNRTATISAYTDTADETAAFKFLRYRGTKGSEAATADEDYLGTISFKGFDGTDYSANGVTRITSVIADPPTAGNINSRIAVNKIGSGANSLIIWGSGNVGINSPSTTSDALTINGRTTADNAVKAGNDPTCLTSDDEGTLRFTGTEYEYCKGDGGGGYFWESVVTDPTCKDDAIFVDMSVSGTGSCATLSNGQSVCWGNNNYNQLGNSSSNDPEVDLRPMNTHKATQIVSGPESSCMLTDDQRIKCVGRNQVYQLGNATNTNSDVPLYIASTNQYTKLSSGYAYICAIRTDKKVDCWGWNPDGQAGAGAPSAVSVPTEIPNLSNVVDIATGVYHSCALLSDRSVKCWGGNLEGQLGLGTETANELIPKTVAITDVIKISAGGGGTENGTCALKADGTVWCWGDNLFGQMGNGTTGAANITTPTQVSGITNAIDVVRHRRGAVALLDDGTVKYWGRYESYGTVTTPTIVAGISNAVKLADGPHALHTCAILTDGSAKCWGYGLTGQLGDGNTVNSGATTVDVINPLSCAADKYVFVTSNTYNGNLGGLKGADNICQAHADRANLPGRYMAWLSDDTGSPATRFNRALTDYKLVDDTVIANGWYDLTDGTLDNALDLQENGTPLGGSMWSNTATDGSLLTNVHCNNWTTNNAAKNGNLGFSASTNSDWTTYSSNLTTPCSSLALNMYCFQQ